MYYFYISYKLSLLHETYYVFDIQYFWYTHCTACTILTSNYSNQQKHKNNSKSYITYSIPRCFNADSPTPGNPEYKGVQLPKQQFGITVIKYQNIKFMKLLSSLTSEVIWDEDVGKRPRFYILIFHVCVQYLF